MPLIASDVKVPRDAQIGYGVIIHSGTRIGSHVIIRDYAIIGGLSFSLKKESQGWVTKPHAGGVVIGDNVTISQRVTVHKGFSGDTTIGNGSIINTHSVIGHDVHIGKRCQINADVYLAGHVHVGDDVVIEPRATVQHRVTIGNGAHIGMAALVMKDVAPNEVVLGHPAIPQRDYRNMRKTMRSLKLIP